MRKSRQKAQRAMTRLFQAHQYRPPFQLSDQWQAGVMDDVLALAGAGAPAQSARWTAPLAGLLFRFAGAGVFVAMVLLLYATIFAPDIESQAAVLIIDNPAIVLPTESLIWS